tara:strand:+ start:102 stop:536 length:435 start_codon:yes stop_codon:yes gene_type:complete
MIEKDIDNIILHQIEKTGKTVKSYSQKEFDKIGLGITIDQWFLLQIIEESNEISQKELADKSMRDPASITRTLDILTKKGFVLREPIPNNKRQHSLSLTSVGDDFVKEHIDMVVKQRKKSIKGFSKEELMMLNALLKRIQKNMK